MKKRYAVATISLTTMLTLLAPTAHGEAGAEHEQKSFALVVPRLEGTLTLDGKHDEAQWKDLFKNRQAVIDSWHRVGRTDVPSYDRRRVALAYDDKFLYVGFDAEMGDDEDLLDGNQKTEMDGLQLDFGPLVSLGIRMDGRQMQILLPYLIPIRFAVKETDAGWTAEIAIPWGDIGGKPAPAEKRPFNAAGFDLSGAITWAPVEDFRDADHYGTYRLAQ